MYAFSLRCAFKSVEGVMIGARKWWALAGVQLAVLAVGLDITVLSVALPTLATDLHATESDLQWFSSGYTLVLAAAMLPAGLIGDRYGRKKVMLAALALFAAGSLACAYAPSVGAFLAARLVLGLAGAGVVVLAMSALVVLFDERERPRAVAVWAAANFLSLPIGPVLGGWLLSRYWWGWIFLVNVPVALVGLAAAAALVPESRAPQAAGIDVTGVVLSSAGLAAVTFGLIEAGQDGWSDPRAIAWMAAGIAVLAAFLGWERRLTRRPGGQPLINLALFRSASFTWGIVLVAVGSAALVGVLFTMPQYFQGVLGTSAMSSGLRLLPLIGGFVAGLVPASGLTRLLGAKVTVAAGFAVFGAGLAIGAGTSASSGGGFAAAWLAVVGAGLGLMFATASSASLSDLSEAEAGVASGMVQALKSIGAPFGSAIMGSVLASGYQARLAVGGLPPAAAAAARTSLFGALAAARDLKSAALATSARGAFVHGMDAALLVAAGIAAAGLVLTLAFLPGRSRPRERAEPAREPGGSHAITP
jgi:DHA2 family multidrug resistance protein-like MFS transporter